MIEKIMSKLGMVVLWCIVIIYGIVVITHICSDIIGVVVLVILAVVSIAFVLFAKRYKIWFKRRVKMLSTICEKSPDDSYIMPEDKFTESFDSANFFVQYKPETKEFFFCSYYYFIFPDYVETWSKAVKEVKALVSRNKSRSEFRRSAWQGLHADNVSQGCQEKFFVVLSSFVHPSEKPASMQ